MLVERHNAFFTSEHRRANRDRILTPGLQKLVYLFRLGVFGEDFKEGRGRKALDAGCGSGFNTVTLGLLGWDPHGLEISPEMAEMARSNAEKYGVNADVRVGLNQSIPFDDGDFWLLLSMNSIHYVQTCEEIRQAFAEFARVLVSGGRIYLTTSHPDNWIFQGGEPVGEHGIRVVQAGDYRDGLVLFRFRNERELLDFAKPYFTDLRIGTDVQEYFTKTLRNYVLTGVRK